MSIIEKAITKLDQGKAAIANNKHLPSPLAVKLPSVAASVFNTQDRPTKPHLVDNKPGKVVEIDLDLLHQFGMVTPDAERSSIAQEFRRIKRPLLEKIFNPINANVRHNNLIMIASSLPGEGKTFCAVNLAISIALEMDRTVLLVDADVARPAVPRYLKSDPDHGVFKVGLMDILLDQNLDLADVMLRSNINALTLLPSGRYHKHATELLASNAMNKLLDEISERYPDRVIIFDSPPLLISTEARVLASQMGHIILIVEAESTTQYSIKEVLGQLRSTTNVSFVFNKAKEFSGGNYYGSYYGDYHHKHQGEHDSKGPGDQHG